VAETVRRADSSQEEIWCVCDADDTSSKDLKNAFSLAERNGVNLCLSVRSFEVWLALHWGKISVAPLTCERDAVALVRKCHSNTIKKRSSFRLACSTHSVKLRMRMRSGLSSKVS
jgi:hypothetical protein